MTPSPTVLSTAFGAPALEQLRDVLAAAKAADPFAPVTVIVPNNFVGIAARRALASGDYGPVAAGRAGLIGAQFVTTYRLAEPVGGPRLAAAGRRPASTPMVAAAVRSALAAEAGMFAPVAEHPTTERRLVAAHRELAELDETQLRSLATQSRRAADVVRIHRRITAILSSGWYSEPDLLRVAADAIERGEIDLSHVGAAVLHLPQEISAARAGFLIALAQRVPFTVIAGLTGDGDADRTIVDGLARMGWVPPPPANPASTNFDLTSVSDADDEVRHAIRGIVDASRQGVAFDRMAVVYASDQPYLRLLHDQLGAAGIPFNGAAVATVAESAAGRLLRRLLSLSDRGFRREDVTALLAGSPLRDQRGLIPSRAWEQVSRDAGIVKGKADWMEKLSRRIADLTAEIAEYGDDPVWEWRSRRLRRQLELTRSFAGFMADLIAQLDRGQQLEGWKDRSRWCQDLLRRYLGAERDWPVEQRRASERVGAILDRLAGLDEVERAPSTAVFRRSLDLELDGGLGRIGSYGNGVLVGPAWMSVGLDLDRVWILGLSEGTFPSRPRDDSLLPDRERTAAPDLRLRSSRTGDEHRHFLAATAAVGPTGHAHLLRPRGDLRQSDERAPSRWLVDLAEQRLGHRPPGSAIDHLDQPWVHHVPSFAGGVLTAVFPATEQEFELQSLVRELVAEGHVRNHPLVASGALARSAEMQAGRAGSTFTAFDGNLAGIDTPDLAADGRATSATALETWARCPHQYFMRYLLGVDPLETPELRLRIDALSKGSLVHDVLERFVQERIENPPEEPMYGWDSADRDRLQQIASAAFAAAAARGLTGEALYWRRDQVLIRRDLDAFFQHDSDRRRDGRLRPIATELGFGLRGTEPVAVALPNGRRQLLLRGSIDLVDEADDGSLVVIDYKTGAETKITVENPHLGGTKLQLVLYAIAARAVLGRPDGAVTSSYWHIRAKSKYSMHGYAVSADVQRSVLAAVQTIVDNIRRGVFPQHPEETTRTQWVSCHFCEPDGLGTADARRRLLRKAAAPELQDFLVLAAPDLVPPARLPAVIGDS